jgi:AraC family transcriptional regulator
MATELAFHVQRDSTIEAHRQAVERVIVEMRNRFDEPLTLCDMAQIACLSSFHFDRVFRQTTGIPPVQFLYALRLEAAKRLLLTTSLSITDVCYEVGYNSIGTFTSRFTQLVGLSPRQFRRLATQIQYTGLHTMLDEAATLERPAAASAVTGRIVTLQPIQSFVFVGLFPTLIPQGRPVAGTLLIGSNSYHISPVKDGRYNAFAAAFPLTKEPQAYLLPEATSLLVGLGQRPVKVQDGDPGYSVDIVLRPLRITDPPILIALPFLLVETPGDDELIGRPGR